MYLKLAEQGASITILRSSFRRNLRMATKHKQKTPSARSGVLFMATYLSLGLIHDGVPFCTLTGSFLHSSSMEAFNFRRHRLHFSHASRYLSSSPFIFGGFDSGFSLLYITFIFSHVLTRAADRKLYSSVQFCHFLRPLFFILTGSIYPGTFTHFAKLIFCSSLVLKK